MNKILMHEVDVTSVRWILKARPERHSNPAVPHDKFALAFDNLVITLDRPQLDVLLRQMTAVIATVDGSRETS